MTFVLPVTQSGVTPEVERPDPSRVVSGDPVHTTWSNEERGNIYSGMWQTTPGAFRMTYTEWEYVHIRSGHSILRGDDGQVVHLRAGDSWIIRPGFTGVWEAVETTLKDYVIIMPEGQED
jgi:hypothetical protein